ncbi:hypothetical protein IQ220_08985 [Cyanobium sp. LEGE 06113]|nr:hypothetical protein [Cyanobium sp. LEGE 06113]
MDCPGSELHLRPLFPVAIAEVQRRPDPLELAIQLQDLLALRGDACSNPDPGCAWTGDLQGVWQLHRHATFAPLVRQLCGHAAEFLEQLGFAPERVALQVQRCWPVLSEFGQVVGRHHHPNAHLSAVYYFTGDGGGEQGSLRLFAPTTGNELVPGMAVGHDGPLRASAWTQPWVDVAPRAGLLLLFPASLDHAVLPNRDPDSLRCSLSLDLVLSAPAGTAPPEYLAPHPSHWQDLGSGPIGWEDGQHQPDDGRLRD